MASSVSTDLPATMSLDEVTRAGNSPALSPGNVGVASGTSCAPLLPLLIPDDGHDPRARTRQHPSTRLAIPASCPGRCGAMPDPDQAACGVRPTRTNRYGVWGHAERGSCTSRGQVLG